MKLNKRVKRSLIGMVGLMILSLGATIVIVATNFDEIKESISETQKGQDDIRDLTNEESKPSLSTDDITDIDYHTSEDKYVIYNKLSSDDSSTITSTQAEILIHNVRKFNREFDFASAEKLLISTLSEVDLANDENSEVIKRLFSDSAILTHYEEIQKEGNLNLLVEGLHNNWVSDMENFLLSVLYLPMDDRETFLLTEDCLNPVFDGVLTVTENNTLQVETIKELEDEFRVSIRQANQFAISLEDSALTVTVIQCDDGNFKIAQFINAEGTVSRYKTVKEWSVIRESLGVK